MSSVWRERARVSASANVSQRLRRASWKLKRRSSSPIDAENENEEEVVDVTSVEDGRLTLTSLGSVGSAMHATVKMKKARKQEHEELRQHEHGEKEKEERRK